MDELHHNLEVRPYNNTTVSNFWGALQSGFFSPMLTVSLKDKNIDYSRLS